MNTKADIVAYISKRSGLPRDLVMEVLNDFIDYVEDSVRERGEFSLKSLFTIQSYPLEARVTHNPRTGEKKVSPPTRRISIKMSSRLRNAFHEELDRDPYHFDS